MGNVSDKSCTENKNTHFMFSNFFAKIVPFMRYGGKIRYSQTGHGWQYNMAHVLCMLDNEGRDTHSEYVIFIAFPLQWLHERASKLGYTYSTLCVLLHFTEGGFGDSVLKTTPRSLLSSYHNL